MDNNTKKLLNEFNGSILALYRNFTTSTERAKEARIIYENDKNHTLDCHSYNAAYFVRGCVERNRIQHRPASTTCSFNL